MKEPTDSVVFEDPLLPSDILFNYKVPLQRHHMKVTDI